MTIENNSFLGFSRLFFKKHDCFFASYSSFLIENAILAFANANNQITVPIDFFGQAYIFVYVSLSNYFLLVSTMSQKKHNKSTKTNTKN